MNKRKVRYVVEVSDNADEWFKIDHCNLQTVTTDLLKGTRVREQWCVRVVDCPVLPDARMGYGMGLSNIYLKSRHDDRVKVKLNIRRVLYTMEQVQGGGKLFLACDGEVVGCEC